MSRVNTPILTEETRKELENGLRMGKTHAFRKRCQLILLKSESRHSSEVASIVKMCEMSVNNWVNRFKKEGIDGLKTKAGRGRKAILNKAEDQELIKKLVQSNRQRVETAKAEWETEHGGKQVSRETFRRFLKALAEGTNASVEDVKANPTPNSINSK